MPLSIPVEFAKELFGRRLIATTLDQDIENIALLIDRPPEIVPLAVNRKKYLVQMPLVTRPRALATQLVRVCLTKLTTPLADRFLRHDDPTGKQQLFANPLAEAEPVIEIDAMAADLDRKAVIL